MKRSGMEEAQGEETGQRSLTTIEEAQLNLAALQGCRGPGPLN
jgi:hypothetical protein